ncbi:hypothetical protein FE257_005314 [Aspergillus nanangensis]|uniref:Uncharacterized protein n=1 Tax=Aspergillus nanangensis TaxID=2582783 RepID=A0AAD4CAA9_ASPNN|nr:hypothetical protein FE257_005314 [Aspergillus nanangensis]
MVLLYTGGAIGTLTASSLSWHLPSAQIFSSSVFLYDDRFTAVDPNVNSRHKRSIAVRAISTKTITRTFTSTDLTDCDCTDTTSKFTTRTTLASTVSATATQSETTTVSDVNSSPRPETTATATATVIQTDAVGTTRTLSDTVSVTETTTATVSQATTATLKVTVYKTSTATESALATLSEVHTGPSQSTITVTKNITVVTSPQLTRDAEKAKMITDSEIGTETVAVTFPGVTRTVNAVTLKDYTTDVASAHTSLDSPVQVSICPSRIINPSYTPPWPQPTDYTWGCPPGLLCHPEEKACNFEAGPPADSYRCRPEECIPLPPLLPPQSWSGRIGTFDISPGYFNLNPALFGLSHRIFRFPMGIELGRRIEPLTVPGDCYPECNDAMLEAQKGKRPELCESGSAFYRLLDNCKLCVEAANSTATTARILPNFQQFLFYCRASSPMTVPPTSSSPPKSPLAATYRSNPSSTAVSPIPGAKTSSSPSSTPLSSTPSVTSLLFQGGGAATKVYSAWTATIWSCLVILFRH